MSEFDTGSAVTRRRALALGGGAAAGGVLLSTLGVAGSAAAADHRVARAAAEPRGPLPVDKIQDILQAGP